MDPALTKLLVAASTASIASICATTITRFRNAPAAAFALAGGILPWFILAMLGRGFSFPRILSLGLVCIVSLFLLAIFFFSLDDPSRTRNVVVAVTVVGLCGGVYFASLLGYGLLLMGL